MPEIKQKVTTYLVSYDCDDCAKPDLDCTLIRTKSSPTYLAFEYKYKCPICEKTYVFLEEYPKIVQCI